MKATETSLFIFMQKSAQFIIPIYQRTYSWTTKEQSVRRMTSTSPRGWKN